MIDSHETLISQVYQPSFLFVSSTTCSIHSLYRGYQQQDAHEFMRYLLDRLHTELQGTRWLSAPRKQTNGHTTIVSLIFRGLLLSEVTCRPCGSLYKKIDPFLGTQGFRELGLYSESYIFLCDID